MVVLCFDLLDVGWAFHWPTQGVIRRSFYRWAIQSPKSGIPRHSCLKPQPQDHRSLLIEACSPKSIEQNRWLHEL